MRARWPVMPVMPGKAAQTKAGISAGLERCLLTTWSTPGNTTPRPADW